jgi:hypothetical protein
LISSITTRIEDGQGVATNSLISRRLKRGPTPSSASRSPKTCRARRADVAEQLLGFALQGGVSRTGLAVVSSPFDHTSGSRDFKAQSRYGR